MMGWAREGCAFFFLPEMLCWTGWRDYERRVGIIPIEQPGT